LWRRPVIRQATASDTRPQRAGTLAGPVCSLARFSLSLSLPLSSEGARRARAVVRGAAQGLRQARGRRRRGPSATAAASEAAKAAYPHLLRPGRAFRSNHRIQQGIGPVVKEGKEEGHREGSGRFAAA